LEDLEMRIGEVATKAGVNVQTIRFYERCGLIKPPRRLTSGYRDYPSGTVKIISFIKRNQKVGFTLNEISQMLKAMATGSPGSLNRKSDIQKRIRALDEHIQALKTTRAELAACLETCVCRDGESPCPVSKSLVEALTQR
jgi:DNA-binding transcriptional MerR regulator